MAQKLFGTDGIRGIANSELTPELAFALGHAVVTVLGGAATTADTAAAPRPRFLIGRDTRRSGQMLEGALSAGIMSAGGDALLAGIVPTPAVARLLCELDCSGGIVISASHNPPEYNGLKVFSAAGFKLPDEQEAAIEALLHTGAAHPETPATPRFTGTAVGTAIPVPDAGERYLNHLTALFAPQALSGLRIALDCGHGASAATSPQALRRLGAEVTAINTDYNGDDINVACGSTHLEALSELVQSGDYDLGIAHDGDADRTLATDETGAVLDGDQIMAICAVDLSENGKLPNPVVVGTIASNLGLTRSLAGLGIRVEHSNVGDRYVLELMRELGATLGGEQSGHVIFLEHNTTGDGLLSALMLADIRARSRRPLSQLARVMTVYPQALKNIPAKRKEKLSESLTIAEAIEAAQAELGDSGRILVRASGTEPLVRVMAEAADLTQAESVVQRLSTLVEQELS